MIALAVRGAKIFVRPGLTDMRKQINGLAVIVEQQMGVSPFDPALFLFCNRQRRILKALYWDATGFCLWQKKLEKHQFPWPRHAEEVAREIDEEKRCGCGADLVRIGEEASEKLDVIPPRVRVTRTIRLKYACKACEGSGDEEKPAVRIAPMPPAVIDKGIATAGLLAFIITGKFCDHLPLYRQEKQFARLGVDLSRKTMADWMIKVAAACASATWCRRFSPATRGTYRPTGMAATTGSASEKDWCT